MGLKKAALWAVVLFLVVVVSAATIMTVGFIVVNDQSSSPSATDETTNKSPNKTPTDKIYIHSINETAFKRSPNDPGSTTAVATKDGKRVVLNSSDIEQRLYTKIDAYRQKHNSTKMNHSERLESLARGYSAEMGRENRYGHVSSDGQQSGGRWDEMSNECTLVLENLVHWPISEETVLRMDSRPNTTVEEVIADVVVNAWHNSNEGHRSVLQENDTEYYGIGIYVDTETPASSELIDGNKSSPTHVTIFVTMNSCRGENPDWDYGNKTKVTEGYGENQTETSNPSDSSKSGSLSVWSP